MGKRALVFDVETTGTSPHDRVVSIAGVWCDGSEPTGEHFYLVFNPMRCNHPKAMEAHGLPDWWLRYQPPFASHAQTIHAQFQAADTLVGHNVGFDVRMINHEFGKSELPPIDRPTYCTMQAFRNRGAYGSSSLDACLSQLGLSRSGSKHCALEDVFLTVNLFRWLKGKKVPLSMPVPLPSPQNATAIPEQVVWADAVDAASSTEDCPAPPPGARELLSQYGVATAGLPPHRIRILLAACEYATVLARRTPAEESNDQIRALMFALADHSVFAGAVRDWSRWAWGRPNPQIARDELRAFAEDVLLQTA